MVGTGNDQPTDNLRRIKSTEAKGLTSYRARDNVRVVEFDARRICLLFFPPIITPVRAPRARYTILGEAIRYIVPGHMQCSIGCGGQSCKYDNPSYWSDNQQAIKGLYSSWVTDHLLAMSRPSTEIIEKYNIIDQFRRNGIKTVINLQIPGEHASCGNPLEPESGFSYHPEVFMENNIYFYNFGWSDYGVANLTAVLDMVKVMAFALQEGKIAVHCHAGLGRTGVLLACFLAYATRMTANQAILFVRAKRPNSIQTRGQLNCVRQFVQFLAPLRSVFSCAEPRFNPVTLSQYLNRQRHILHGSERKELRHLPKIVQLVSRLLIDIAENRQVIEEDILEAPDIHDLEMTLSIIEEMGPEMFSKQPRLPGTPTLPRHFNEPPIFYHRKSLSYSESDLRRLGSQLNLLTQPLSTVTQSNAELSITPTKAAVTGTQSQSFHSNVSDVSQGSLGSLWQVKNVEIQKDVSILLKKVKQKTIKRSESVGNREPTKQGSMLSRWKAEQREELVMNGMKPQVREEEQSEKSEVPFITLQSELSLEARRLLVAQSLAVDLFLDGEEEHKSKVLSWQAELNLGGGWERLCMERDPFILTGLMWAWLEQLKEPVISIQEAKALNPNTDAQTVLNTLDQASKQTLTCILDCMAHMLMIPQEVENAFLNRTIKAFTWMKNDPEDGSKVYESMTAVLRGVLEDMRNEVLVKDETPTSPSSFTLT
ncbi:protein tyrosine phosphatase domain-containing protein 1 [Plectropomus leopardus]|uniref:protein tyrosine phosphatase domain-containing protein 1 n=1 Tax=Plectropomus leopardus TaxID=160734 RepID=UPI001C4CBA47|nr:protein tyrosine phosphatase domain-containing protein 1 [Plectropomus leopardus]